MKKRSLFTFICYSTVRNRMFVKRYFFLPVWSLKTGKDDEYKIGYKYRYFTKIKKLLT